MARKIEDRVFFHSKYSHYSIPNDEPTGERDENDKPIMSTRMIVFHNHTFRTNEPADIAILEAKMAANPDICEIDPSKQQDIIGLIKSGEVKPSGVPKVSAIGTK
jgi:hypothetical protein